MTTTPPGLPELTDARRDAIEAELFRRIAADSPPRRLQTRRWLVPLSGAAAVLVVATVIGGALRGGDAGTSATDGPAFEQHGSGAVIQQDAEGGAWGITGGADGAVPNEGSDESAPGEEATAQREVVATASAALEVDDAAGAVDALAREAAERGGYVESSGVSASTTDGQDVGVTPGADISRPASDAWVTVRVPADQLDPLLGALSGLGTVRFSEVDRADVTLEATDLRARVAALDASVARLTDLIAQAGSTADLLDAESALSERQAERDSLQAQLTALESRIALSSLTVSISEPAEAVRADPNGFGDGLATGWNTLLAVLNATVIGLGFLLPWLVPTAAVAAIVVALARRRRRRRAALPD